MFGSHSLELKEMMQGIYPFLNTAISPPFRALSVLTAFSLSVASLSAVAVCPATLHIKNV